MRDEKRLRDFLSRRPPRRLDCVTIVVRVPSPPAARGLPAAWLVGRTGDSPRILLERGGGGGVGGVRKMAALFVCLSVSVCVCSLVAEA